MSTIFFNKENCKTNSTGEATLRINPSNSLISIGKVAMQKMGLKPKQKIEFALDKDKFYIMDARNENGFELRGSEDKNLFISNGVLVEKIVDLFKIKDNFSLLIGSQSLIEHEKAYVLTLITKTS